MSRRLSLALYRGLLRWGNNCGEAPPFRELPPTESISKEERQRDILDLLSTSGVELSGNTVERFLELQHSSRTAKCEIRQLTRLMFTALRDVQGDRLDMAHDFGLRALRLLNQNYSPLLEQMQALRAERARSTDMLYHIGQVLWHEGHCCHGVVIGWESAIDSDKFAPSARPSTKGEDEQTAKEKDDSASRVVYHLLADEVEAAVALKGKYLPSSALLAEQASVKEAESGMRIRNRHALDFFRGYSPRHSRYIPKQVLQYLYPDSYSTDDDDMVECNDDANILFFES